MSALAQYVRVEALPVSSLQRGGSDPSLYAIRSSSRSAIMLNVIEANIRDKEEKFGRERLLRTIAEIPRVDRAQHIERYRNVIRSNHWPNEANFSSLDKFLDDYQRSAQIYVSVGFEALDFIAGTSALSLDEIYARVLGSEALRGQFGKRCPSGLDARLDDCVARLEEGLLSIAPVSFDEGAIDLLCTPTKPELAAESLLLEDFAQLRDEFSSPPTIDDVLRSTGLRKDIVWNFLRRYVRWGVDELPAYYQHFSSALFDEQLRANRVERSVQAMRRNRLISEITNRCDDPVCLEILGIATAVTALNHLNLALEPSYSFKGGPGISHGIVFALAEVAGLKSSLEQISRIKWELFDAGAALGGSSYVWTY